jgi:glycosyltransferase involved in cell wall biosynthesis
MLLSLIIPARNEAKRIEGTLVAYAEAFARDTEILVVVNGTTDATVDIARRCAEPYPHVTVIDIPGKIGKGGAVRAGFAQARGTYVGFVDADMATAPHEFRRILVAARNGDGAFGSRWVRGSRVLGRSPLRAVASRMFVSLVQSLVGLHWADTQCGAKIFHRRFLPAYLAESRVNDLAFDVELLLLLQRAGARLVEVPTVWVSQPGSNALGSPFAFVRHAMTMLRSILQLRRERGGPPLRAEAAAPATAPAPAETPANGAR